MFTMNFAKSCCSLYLKVQIYLQTFNHDYDLAFDTTYVVCANFKHVMRYLQIEVDSEQQIFLEKIFILIFI